MATLGEKRVHRQTGEILELIVVYVKGKPHYVWASTGEYAPRKTPNDHPSFPQDTCGYCGHLRRLRRCRYCQSFRS